MIRHSAVVFLLLTLPCALAAEPTVSYVLGMSRPSSHLFEVDLVIDGLDGRDSTLDVVFPVWRPGRYVVLDLANGVVEFHASDGLQKPLPWKKADKTTWNVRTNGATKLHVRYKLFANEFHLRTRGLNDERAFVDGSAVFMFVEAYRHLPVTLTLLPFGDWRVTTGLDTVQGKLNTFSAPTYDYLADCPLEIGSQNDYVFTVEGREHVLSIAGEGNHNPDSLIADVSKIINTTVTFWQTVPYKRYVFLLALAPTGGGGTEHINSTAMAARPFIFKNPEAYRGFLSLVSHEFFHTWNVKQLRPAGLAQYTWTKENYTEELWIAEGTSSYYDDLLLVRSGLATEHWYLERISGAMEADRNRPGNMRQSLADCSFDAWIKYWKPGRRTFNHETDYYARGAAVSFVLDMTIRQRTKNKRSLDDVMRVMYRRFPLSSDGYTNADFRKACEDVAGSSFDEFFRDFVDGAKPLLWEEALGVAGLMLEDKESEQSPWLGLGASEDGERLRVTRVTDGSPAYEAGLNIDDEIVAVNGYKARLGDLNARVAESKEGNTLRLTVFRDERLREFSVTLRLLPTPSQRIVKRDKPGSMQKEVFSSWLRTGREKK